MKNLNSWYIEIWVELKLFSRGNYRSNKKVLSSRDVMNYQIIVLSRSIVSWYTPWKVSQYGVFSGPYFPAFGLNTERYVKNSRRNFVFGHFSRSGCIQSNFIEDFPSFIAIKAVCLWTSSTVYARSKQSMYLNNTNVEIGPKQRFVRK